MQLEPGLEEFATSLLQEIIAISEVKGQECLRTDAFTQYMIGLLTDNGEIDDGEVCYHRTGKFEVNGYSVNEENESLNLFIAIHKQCNPPTTIGKKEIDGAFKRLSRFLFRALGDYYASLEVASPVFDMVYRIQQLKKSLRYVRLFLFTDGLTNQEAVLTEQVSGINISYHIWDLRRIFRSNSSGRAREPIDIDFLKRFGEAIPCLTTHQHDKADYKAFLAVFPGKVLHELYQEFGARLLELNVRSFLQVRGKVNKGIRDTICKQPSRFLAYNNGISSTATDIQLAELEEGGKGITRISDFQIVNGGQTTASLFQAVRKDGADVSSVFVQAKITVVPFEEVKKLVPLISRYANSQNKINEADFYANDPFHVKLQHWSRATWAPAADGTQRQTIWFYERARGQYQDELSREGTTAKKNKFKTIHPKNQMFTKTDLAKFENTWHQLPNIVSFGAEKNFREFTVSRSEMGDFEPELEYFQRLIGKAILFRSAEQIVSAQKFGGYRANIVTYTISYISHVTAQGIDLDKIWHTQKISLALSSFIKLVCQKVREVIIAPPNGQNISEWCKRPACWTAVKALSIDVPDDLVIELIQTESAKSKGGPSYSEAEMAIIDEMGAYHEQKWLNLFIWAKQTNSLLPQLRHRIKTLANLARSGKTLSLKQAEQAKALISEAERLGFKFS
jgi:hypothetical protein